MSDEDTPQNGIGSAIIEEDVGEMEVVDASAVEDSNNDEDERKPWDPIETDTESEEEEYEVEKIVAARFVKKKRQYLVKWVNYAEEWNTWEPIENLEGSHELVEDFNKREREKEEEKEKQKAAANAKRKADKERKEAEREKKELEKKEREEKKAKLEKEKKEIMEPSDSDPEQPEVPSDTTPDRKKERESERKDEKKVKKEKKDQKRKKDEKSNSIKDEKMRKKKEKLQKEREKWRKEREEFRQREENIARRKSSQNAYKKKESGNDFYEDQSLNATSLPFPEEPEEKSIKDIKPNNDEVKIEEEATIRILLSTTQADSEWQYYIGKKYRQFEKNGAKIQVTDAMEPFSLVNYKTQIGHCELLLSITGTPKVISMTVKDLVDKLTQERYKKIPKVAKENKWIILNFVIRSNLWDCICGKENSNFYDFQVKCFSKLAAGPNLPESCDKILRAEGRDAGLGLAARRIATVLTKELKDIEDAIEDKDYVPYRPQAYQKGTGKQVEIISGRMEPKPDQVRVDGVAEITSVDCIINHIEDEDEAAVNIEFVGEAANITKCKACLISNNILTSHSIETNILELFKRQEVNVKKEKRESCIYNMESVICSRSVVAHGLIGKIDQTEFENHAAQFGEIQSIKQASPSSEWNGNSYNSFLIEYKEEQSAKKALNEMTHLYGATEFKFIPYRLGDFESERQSRFVLLQNLPNVSEAQLKMRFENDGVVAARLDKANSTVGYLLLSKKQSAQRFHKNGSIDYHPGRNCPVNTLDISQITKVLDEPSRRRILTELEIGFINESNEDEIERMKELRWYLPTVQQPSLERKRKFPIYADRDPLRLDEIGRSKPKIQPSASSNTNLLANIMSGIDVETDKKVIESRQTAINEFLNSAAYSYWSTHCEFKSNTEFKVPDFKARYPREAVFQRKKFEWSNSISEWGENHRNRMRHMSPPDDDFDDQPPMDDDDPFNPAKTIPGPATPDAIPPHQSNSESQPVGMEDSVQIEHSSNPNTNLLMPTRRKRRPNVENTFSTPSNVDSPSKPPPPQSGGGSLKSILGGLDKELLEKLKNKKDPEPEPEIEFDPKQSILTNPPQELRTVLRALRLDVMDLKTLLDIPLAIISSQNVISLVELKNNSLGHMDKNDTTKLVELLKKYLTPPDETIEQSPLKSGTSSQSSQRTDKREEFPEDVIYTNIEFREILTDCISIFAEGKELMTQIYESVVNEHASPNTAHL